MSIIGSKVSAKRYSDRRDEVITGIVLDKVRQKECDHYLIQTKDNRVESVYCTSLMEISDQHPVNNHIFTVGADSGSATLGEAARLTHKEFDRECKGSMKLKTGCGNCAKCDKYLAEIAIEYPLMREGMMTVFYQGVKVKHKSHSTWVQLVEEINGPRKVSNGGMFTIGERSFLDNIKDESFDSGWKIVKD